MPTLFLVFACCLTISAQSGEPMAKVDHTERVTTKKVLEDRFLPQFPAGEVELINTLRESVEYPELARDYNVEGTVHVQVEVDASGKVSFDRILIPLFPDCDQVAKEAASKLPNFLPAVENGVPVARKIVIPFHFSLQ